MPRDSQSSVIDATRMINGPRAPECGAHIGGKSHSTAPKKDGSPRPGHVGLAHCRCCGIGFYGEPSAWCLTGRPVKHTFVVKANWEDEPASGTSNTATHASMPTPTLREGIAKPPGILEDRIEVSGEPHAAKIAIEGSPGPSQRCGSRRQSSLPAAPRQVARGALRISSSKTRANHEIWRSPISARRFNAGRGGKAFQRPRLPALA
jgi:hypothetical protein